MTKAKPAAHHGERFDLYQHVTNQIVAALEQGVRPWVQPWSSDHLACRIGRPLRACGKGYRGINVLVLWLTATAQGYRSPFWLTFKQALGRCQVGGGERVCRRHCSFRTVNQAARATPATSRQV